MMISVGVGMCLSNAKAVLAGVDQPAALNSGGHLSYSVTERGVSWKKNCIAAGNHSGGFHRNGFRSLFYCGLDGGFYSIEAMDQPALHRALWIWLCVCGFPDRYARPVAAVPT